jgi:hypothetical protein
LYPLSIAGKSEWREEKPGVPDASCKSKQSYNKRPNLLESGTQVLFLTYFYLTQAFCGVLLSFLVRSELFNLCFQHKLKRPLAEIKKKKIIPSGWHATLVPRFAPMLTQKS